MKTSPKFKQNLKSQVKFSDEKLREIDDIEQLAIARYMGELNELESALGMLKMGYHWGWKALYLNHSKATVRKYEQILGISVREQFPEEGPSAHRHVGLNLAKKIGNFWKVVSGEKPISPSEKKIAEQ